MAWPEPPTLHVASRSDARAVSSSTPVVLIRRLPLLLRRSTHMFSSSSINMLDDRLRKPFRSPSANTDWRAVATRPVTRSTNWVLETDSNEPRTAVTLPWNFLPNTLSTRPWSARDSEVWYTSATMRAMPSPAGRCERISTLGSLVAEAEMAEETAWKT